MATSAKLKSKVVHLETATITLSGAVSDDSDSDTETPSESESESNEPIRNKNKGTQHIALESNSFSLDNSQGNVSKNTKTTVRGSPGVLDNSVVTPTSDDQSVQNCNGIAQVMVDSSDSGCPCSPMDESDTKRDPDTDKERLASCIVAEDTELLDSGENGTNTFSHDVSSTILNEMQHSDHSSQVKECESVSTTGGATVASSFNTSDQNVKEHSPIPASGTPSPTRFNPFNKVEEDVDPFPQLHQNRTQSGQVSSDSWSEDDASKENSVKNGMGNLELGITEDYFSQPEGHFGAFSIEELELAIANCCKMVMEIGTDNENKKELVHKLVQLRLKLAEAKDEEVTPDSDKKLVVGHMFQVKDTQRSRRYCEHCNTLIWGVLQNWYRCEKCGFSCHEKCLELVERTCASVKIKESPEYIMSICPEKSLSHQNYKCAECRTPISFHSSQGEPRLCDYTGSFYCARCHWNDLMIIPSRILHNWDFEPKKVCRGTKQFLKLMKNKPVLRVQDINPMLFNFVEEMNEVKKLREEILVMKKYFLSCREALKSKLLLQLQERQHFVENSDMYSVQDLHDVAQDILLAQLAKIHSSFAQHIKTDCQLCRAKGYHCELCDEHEVLFPFDNIATVCSQCSTVLHRHCFMRRNQKCPKCIRRSSRVE